MLGKKYMHSRGVMIAIAVVALMTLSAGVAAAHSLKANKIEAVGTVAAVGLPGGGTVESDFKTNKAGEIRSVKIKTGGEQFGGGVVMTACEESGKNSEGACAGVPGLLGFVDVSGIYPAVISSAHNSTAHLKNVELGLYEAPVTAGGVQVGVQPIPVIWGTLKGSLKADLSVDAPVSEDMAGTAKMKIKSPEGELSAYACFDAVTFTTIDVCQNAPGENVLGFSPVLIPVVLHVEDSGTFKATNSTTKLSGKINVTVDSHLEFAFDGSGPLPVPDVKTSGSIVITKGKAEFAVDDHDHKGKKDKKPKKGDDDDDD